MNEESILLICINHNLKRTARATAQAFDTALRPYNLRSGQFAALAALRQAGSIPMKDMGDLLGLDRTTLLRNLEPLEERGLIERSKKGRQIILELTTQGRTLFRQAFPAWRRMQDSILKGFGKGRWQNMKDDCRDLEKKTQDAVGTLLEG